MAPQIRIKVIHPEVPKDNGKYFWQEREPASVKLYLGGLVTPCNGLGRQTPLVPGHKTELPEPQAPLFLFSSWQHYSLLNHRMIPGGGTLGHILRTPEHLRDTDGPSSASVTLSSLNSIFLPDLKLGAWKDNQRLGTSRVQKKGEVSDCDLQTP